MTDNYSKRGNFNLYSKRLNPTKFKNVTERDRNSIELGSNISFQFKKYSVHKGDKK
jgi:hypothetical protein